MDEQTIVRQKNGRQWIENTAKREQDVRKNPETNPRTSTG